MPLPVRSPGPLDVWRWRFEVPPGYTWSVREGVPGRFVRGCLLFYILYVLNLNIEINHPDSFSLPPLHLDQVEPNKIVDGSFASALR